VSTWNEILEEFTPISLEEMDAVKLMNRMDTKFSFPLVQLPALLERLKADYKVLSIEGKRISNYVSKYVDTPDLQFFKHHHSGKVNRCKVRFRTYTESSQTYFEVKFKNNKQRTLKSRIRVELESSEITEKCLALLGNYIPTDNLELVPSIRIDYDRITLVNKIHQERVTLDLNLTFFRGDATKTFPQLVIAEVKRDKLAHRSPFLVLMKEKHIRPGSLSKYCFGLAQLETSLKQNNFKPRISSLIQKSNASSRYLF
jgi:hypothetical protein